MREDNRSDHARRNNLVLANQPLIIKLVWCVTNLIGLITKTVLVNIWFDHIKIFELNVKAVLRGGYENLQN